MPYETQFNTTFYLFVDPKNEEADKELCQLQSAVQSLLKRDSAFRESSPDEECRILGEVALLAQNQASS